ENGELAKLTQAQKDSLIARQRRAAAQQTVADATAQFSPMDPSAELNRIERQIRGAESKAAATAEMQDTSVDAQFAELDYDTDVEDQLAQLKAKLGPATEALPAASSSSPTSNPQV
ncbi:MAG TPA: PspA/IM30 family protein, partial [Thermomicrobiales bacterium]|nr:PspA/IM30 family protein [Thermomicrobiales bacterium]